MESPDKVRTLESLSANAADAVVGVNFASLKVTIQKDGTANKSVPKDLLLHIRQKTKPKLKAQNFWPSCRNFAEMIVVSVSGQNVCIYNK